MTRTGRGIKDRARGRRVSAVVSLGVVAALGVALSAATITLVIVRNPGGSGERPSTATARARLGEQPAAPKWHLVFTSNRDGDSDVYAASRDGARIAALTRNRVSDDLVDVAPDGRILVDRDSSVRVLVSPDGRHERPVGGDTENVAEEALFALGGKAIVLSREDMYTGKGLMFLISVDGTTTRPLGPGYAMEVSGDGRYLVFATDNDNELGIYELDRMTKRIVSAKSFGEWVSFAPG
ncbi:MAG TPA: hypothetical protein VFJ79_02690, partial [Acidimicrobiales bacterium]|nr:hypothetical protein [Acidimicrobiales bacterium]